MKLIRLLATAMAGAATLPAVGTAPAELSANRSAAAGQIGTGPPRSDEQIYYSI
jgi:hypothetical protein